MLASICATEENGSYRSHPFPSLCPQQYRPQTELMRSHCSSASPRGDRNYSPYPYPSFYPYHCPHPCPSLMPPSPCQHQPYMQQGFQSPYGLPAYPQQTPITTQLFSYPFPVISPFFPTLTPDQQADHLKKLSSPYSKHRDDRDKDQERILKEIDKEFKGLEQGEDTSDLSISEGVRKRGCLIEWDLPRREEKPKRKKRKTNPTSSSTSKITIDHIVGILNSMEIEEVQELLKNAESSKTKLADLLDRVKSAHKEKVTESALFHRLREENYIEFMDFCEIEKDRHELYKKVIAKLRGKAKGIYDASLKAKKRLEKEESTKSPAQRKAHIRVVRKKAENLKTVLQKFHKRSQSDFHEDTVVTDAGKEKKDNSPSYSQDVEEDVADELVSKRNEETCSAFITPQEEAKEDEEECPIPGVGEGFTDKGWLEFMRKLNQK